MHHRKNLYVGFNDEGNEIHAFIDYADIDHLDEFSASELNAKLEAMDSADEDSREYYLLKQKIEHWQRYLH